jgi:dienelactone hydrolase/lysophospholipase L1-like esterase
MLPLLLLLTCAPKVVLVGDSIRLGYAPTVATLLAGQADVISPAGAGDSRWLRDNLDKLILAHEADLIHVNVGLHDLRKGRKDSGYQVPVAEYAKNLDDILSKLKATKATVLFTLTTPVDDELGKKRGGGFDRFNADVAAYNVAALKVAAKHGVVVHDLHSLVAKSGGSALLVKDGTHFTKEGITLQARAVADCVRRHLALRGPAPKPLPVADEKATAAYKAAEKKRDDAVPEAYRKLKVPEFVAPADAAEWKKRRPEVQKKVLQTLGELPERPKPSAELVCREIHPGMIVESLLIPNGDGDKMTALFLAPHSLGEKKAPAILWLHSSSYTSNQLLLRGYNGGDEPLGEAFTKAGYVVLAPDACWYGGRSGAGPSGAVETTRAQQETLLKYHLWRGRTLWGMFVHDDQCALDYLGTRPEADMGRVGVTGMSMGSTRSWWLAAVDERVKCVVGVACLTRYQNLIAHGELRQHGVYYFVFGLLKHFDVEGVLALIAPRPLLFLTGELDAGSPADGIIEVEKRVGAVYAALGAKDAFRSVRYPHTGHVYTPAMRKEMLAWLAKWLR